MGHFYKDIHGPHHFLQEPVFILRYSQHCLLRECDHACGFTPLSLFRGPRLPFPLADHVCQFCAILHLLRILPIHSAAGLLCVALLHLMLRGETDWWDFIVIGRDVWAIHKSPWRILPICRFWFSIWGVTWGPSLLTCLQVMALSPALLISRPCWKVHFHGRPFHCLLSASSQRANT